MDDPNKPGQDDLVFLWTKEPMKKTAPVNLRFSVGNAATGRGFVWRAFSNPNKDDVYLKISDFKGKHSTKFSFHKDRLRYALLNARPHWSPERDRAVFKWERKPISPPGLGHFTPVFQLEVPTDYLNPFSLPTKATFFIPPASAGHAVIVMGGYTLESLDTIKAALPQNSRIINYSPLPNDASFLIISFEALSEKFDMVTKNAVFESNQDRTLRRTRIFMCSEVNADEGFVRIIELGGIPGAPEPLGKFVRLTANEIFESHSEQQQSPGVSTGAFTLKR
ncbi:MAG: hypothetical protein H5U13_07225 [Parvibaculum sp.]|nr:hypothetical protein [Parvibaculum sp.]